MRSCLHKALHLGCGLIRRLYEAARPRDLSAVPESPIPAQPINFIARHRVDSRMGMESDMCSGAFQAKLGSLTPRTSVLQNPAPPQCETHLQLRFNPQDSRGADKHRDSNKEPSLEALRSGLAVRRELSHLPYSGSIRFLGLRFGSHKWFEVQGSFR